MDATADGILVEREIRVEAPRETVWKRLTDPEQHIRWMGEAARLEPVPGGRYEVRVVPGRTAIGTFLEVEPPSRLLLSFGWEPTDARLPPPGSTTVEFRLTTLGDSTLLRLTHRRNPTPESAAGHARGWEHYLARLAGLAAGHPPDPDPWIGNPPTQERQQMPKTSVTPSPGFISIAVSDVEKSAAFYERYLGAVRDTYDFGPKAVAFVGWPTYALSSARPVTAEATGIQVWWRASDAQALFEEATADGVAILEPPFDGPFGRTFVMADPDGYRITVYEKDQPLFWPPRRP